MQMGGQVSSEPPTARHKKPGQALTWSGREGPEAGTEDLQKQGQLSQA